VTIIKAHAYGNDFLFVPESAVTRRDRVVLARALCDRHRGIGADGLIVYRPTGEGAVMWLYNADGSRAEVSGNGVRCLGAILIRAGSDPTQALVIESEGGTKTLTLLGEANGEYFFRAFMGAPEKLRRDTLEVAGRSVTVVALWMGNPQCVCLDEPLDDETFSRLGPALERHDAFPDRTNVELASVESPNRVRIRIWERGVGPTESSGTGSCAAAAAAISFGGATRDVEVVAPGGSQRVEWLDDGIYLTGSATIVLEGKWLG
jgi:diaminopimelate epimerase